MDLQAPLHQNLALFADDLKVSNDVEHKGNVLLDKIVQTILAKSKFDIHRVAKGGSLGKKTAIRMKVDYDCVFFLDATADPDRFMDDLVDVLILNFNLKNDPICTVNSVGFELDGYSFDFLPGEFIVHDPEQQVKTLVQRADYGRARAGLVEGTLIFMKEQSGLTHRLARLLKFWSHTVLVPGFFNGRSYTLELIAALASEEQTNEDLLSGFRIALDKIRNYRKINKVWNRFYSDNLIGDQIRDQRPLLLDVSDPTNNLLEPKRHKFFDMLAEYAQVTLTRLAALSIGMPPQLCNLFQPQPKVWNILRHVPMKYTFLVSAPLNNADIVQPRAIVRLHSQSIQKEMEFYYHNISALFEREYFFNKTLTANDAQEVATKSCDILFNTSNDWSPTTETFDKKNVVLVIPVGKFSSTYVQIGFDVQHNTEFDHRFGKYTQSIAYWDDVPKSMRS